LPEEKVDDFDDGAKPKGDIEGQAPPSTQPQAQPQPQVQLAEEKSGQFYRTHEKVMQTVESSNTIEKQHFTSTYMTVETQEIVTSSMASVSEVSVHCSTIAIAAPVNATALPLPNASTESVDKHSVLEPGPMVEIPKLPSRALRFDEDVIVQTFEPLQSPKQVRFQEEVIVQTFEPLPPPKSIRFNDAVEVRTFEPLPPPKQVRFEDEVDIQTFEPMPSPKQVRFDDEVIVQTFEPLPPAKQIRFNEDVAIQRFVVDPLEHPDRVEQALEPMQPPPCIEITDDQDDVGMANNYTSTHNINTEGIAPLFGDQKRLSSLADTVEVPVLFVTRPSNAESLAEPMDETSAEAMFESLVGDMDNFEELTDTAVIRDSGGESLRGQVDMVESATQELAVGKNGVVEMEPVDALRAVIVMASSVTLVWCDSIEASWYRVEMSSAPGSDSFSIVATELDDTTFSMEGLRCGESVSFRVFAGNDEGFENTGAEITVTPLQPVARITFPEYNSTHAVVSWPSSPGATEYELATLEPNELMTVLIPSTPDCSCVLQNLEAGRTYNFQVRAGKNGVFETVGTTASIACFDPVTHIQASRVTSDTVFLEWSEAVGATKYKIGYCESGQEDSGDIEIFSDHEPTCSVGGFFYIAFHPADADSFVHEHNAFIDFLCVCLILIPH
jgi:hypothetical protein